MPTVKTIATEVSVILGLLDENWTTVCYDELPEELKETFTGRPLDFTKKTLLSAILLSKREKD